MPFITKIDFSSNRQVKQHVDTMTYLSGGTTFGLPFNQLPSGPDLTTTGVTYSATNIVSTFSGNSATTIYTWYDSRMQLAANTLSALTPSNSATTQYALAFTGSQITYIDGNQVNLAYTGVSFDVTDISIVTISANNYSGTVVSRLFNVLSANTLDFTGRTIWVDVSGITRTNDLIITDNPTIGSVWTCISSEGNGGWMPSSGSSGTTLFTAGSANNTAVLIGSNLTSTIPNTIYGTNLILNSGSTYGSNLGINTLTPSYTIDSYDSKGYSELYFDTMGTSPYSSNLNVVSKSSNVSYTTVSAANDVYHPNSYGLSIGALSKNRDAAYVNYGTSGDTVIYSSQYANNLNIISESGNIDMYASSIVIGQPTLRVSSNGVILSGNTTRVSIKTSGGYTGALYYQTDGTIANSSSDIRLKTNINNITNALDKVKNLRGVTYNWLSGETDTKYGFIAQEVNNVIPELAFTNKDTYMGVHYDMFPALLVEAIKELASTSGLVKTQTIVAEDNYIELNYSGNSQTAIGGGIKVLNAISGNKPAEIIVDSDGNWTTNTGLVPNSLTIPMFTPSGSTDANGNLGNVTRDDNYLYLKTNNGWKRTNLESF